MRRTLSMVPFAPIVLASVVLGGYGLGRDFASRAHRWYAELLDEIERNR